MGLQCYTWISHLFKEIIGDYDDAVAAEGILTRFKALTILQCQKVCKQLQMLASSSHSRLNQSRDGPLILLYYHPSYLRLFIIDGKSETECKARGLKSLEDANFASCCNGLVLVSWNGNAYTQYAVLNPLSRERITKIDFPNTWMSQSCGFFFHPLAKEYRILVVARTSSLFAKRTDKTSYEYNIYSFGAKKWRRTANPYFHRRPTCHWKSSNTVDGNPAIANGSLHWYIGEIMVFDMISEEFSVRRLPFEEHFRQKVYFMGYLLAKEDRLCFCVVDCQEPAMDIWILEDYANWSWTIKYIVNLDWDLNIYPMEERFARADMLNVIRVVSIHKDELVLFWRKRGLFSYNLSFHNVKKIPMKKLEMASCRYDNYCGFVAYTATTSDQ